MARGRRASHNRRMLRVDPSYPPVWRSATSLQFGADAIVVLDDPAPWQERIVRHLEGGIADDAFESMASAAGASPSLARSFLERLRPVLSRAVDRGPSPRVRIHAPRGFAHERASSITSAIAASGLIVESVDDVALAAGRQDRSFVVLLADHTIEPRRGSALLHEDVPHLPVVFSAGSIEVGPFVWPGLSACLRCLDEHRMDADPTWALVAAQLLGRPAPTVGAATVIHAGLVAGQMVSAATRGAFSSRSVQLRDDALTRRWRGHHPHAACHCRSLAEIATASAHEDPATSTMTVTAFARHA